MAIIIIDNFQVDINNPIDNRFVVGSQSIPSGGTYPTPFYAYKEDILYKYPGLRIWDFNVNVPYVWSGTQWINENTTSAVVENATTGNTGFQNFLAKFKNNTTLLTKGIVYDNGSNIGIGLTDQEIDPGDMAGAGGLRGLHVSGNIKTNGGFVGIGSGITQIHATNITSGYLDLKRITKPPFPPATGGLYILKNNDGTETGTSWSPFLSNGLQITDDVSTGVNNIRIESKSGTNLGLEFDGIAIYDGLDANKIHQFKRIKSSSLEVEMDGTNSIKIEVPASFEGTDYYVNRGYFGAEQLGTRSKPFRDLKACINKILNRTSNSGPTSYTGGFINGIYDTSLPYNNANPDRPDPMGNVSPDTLDSEINGGQPYKKWEIRTGKNADKPTYSNNYYSTLPGGGAVRVIIQSYCETDENLAINGVTYFLENSDVSNIKVLSDYYNDPGMPENGQPFTYLFDMTSLAGTADLNDPLGREATGVPKGNPVYIGTRPFQIDYGLTCKLEGSGEIGFTELHKKRKGFFRIKAVNSYDFSYAAHLIDSNIPIKNPPDNRIGEYGCSMLVGSEAGYIVCNMNQLPLGFEAAHTQSPIQLYYEDGLTKINREGVDMAGFKTTAVPDYGAIQVEGRNMMFAESLFLAGTLVINCSEQHMIYAKDYGAIYSESGRIYMRRNYQKVLYSTVEFTVTDRVQDPYYLYGDNWYKIISVTGSGTGAYTNWTDTNFFRQTTWKNSIGESIVAPTYSLDSTSWIGLTVQTTTNYNRVDAGQTWNGPSGDATTPFTIADSIYGSNPNSIVHRGRVQQVRKFYRPCNHVYDIYLKNGGVWNQGGDFYTQQNTGANQGGPCAFLCVENNIPSGGDDTHPIDPRVNQNTTGCGFRASGGGFVTNLFYNYHIKYILDESYLVNRNDYKHGIAFKSLKIDSSAFNSVIGVFKTNGANYTNNYLTNADTILGSSTQNWTQFIFIGDFSSCYFFDSFAYSNLRRPFSNISINNGLRVDITNAIYNANNGATGQLYKGLRVDGNNGFGSPDTVWYYYGLMRLGGTTIELSSGSINTNIPTYNGNTEALSSGYPVGGIYLDYNGDGGSNSDGEPILKVVKNVS